MIEIPCIFPEWPEEIQVIRKSLENSDDGGKLRQCKCICAATNWKHFPLRGQFGLKSSGYMTGFNVSGVVTVCIQSVPPKCLEKVLYEAIESESMRKFCWLRLFSIKLLL